MNKLLESSFVEHSNMVNERVLANNLAVEAAAATTANTNTNTNT